MMEPTPIEPEDIRVGDRVRVVSRFDLNQAVPGSTTHEFTVCGLYPGQVRSWTKNFTHSEGYWMLLDRPDARPNPGSHWCDPVTGAEYVATDDATMSYRLYRGDGEIYLNPNNTTDRTIIERLGPIPTFDASGLSRADEGDRTCGVRMPRGGHLCDRASGHDGLHTCDHTEGLFVWGDPR